MIKKILVPTDGSERAEHAGALAIDLAGGTGAELIFIHVVDEIAPAFAYELDSGAYLDLEAVNEQRRSFGNEAVARLKSRADAAGVRSSVIVVDGHPWQEILEQVDKTGADHIVIGSHGRRALVAAVLGNVTVNVIHGSKVPVTVVPWKE
ncbi:MAG: universal stress protein [Thermoleophilia bacterium]